MLIITNYQKNANQSQTGISPHYYEKITNTSGQMENTHKLAGNMNQCFYIGNKLDKQFSTLKTLECNESNRNLHPYIYSCLFYNCQNLESIKMPIIK